MVNAARSYLSQSELRVHFGLGKAAVIDSAVIRWPDGTEQTLDTVEINAVNSVRQPTE